MSTMSTKIKEDIDLNNLKETITEACGTCLSVYIQQAGQIRQSIGKIEYDFDEEFDNGRCVSMAALIHD